MKLVVGVTRSFNLVCKSIFSVPELFVKSFELFSSCSLEVSFWNERRKNDFGFKSFRTFFSFIPTAVNQSDKYWVWLVSSLFEIDCSNFFSVSAYVVCKCRNFLLSSNKGSTTLSTIALCRMTFILTTLHQCNNYF